MNGFVNIIRELLFKPLVVRERLFQVAGERVERADAVAPPAAVIECANRRFSLASALLSRVERSRNLF